MRGANISPFWNFRQDTKSCNLLLSTAALSLEILKTKPNTFPNIKTAAATAVSYSENFYRFDGHEYRLMRRTHQPIGQKIPSNLSGFQTRSPLVQGISQAPDPVLTEARSWLWRQWRLGKPSYLKVTVGSKEGDKTTTTYFITKVDGQPQMMIQRHRIVVDRSPAPNSVVEDELIVAANVERRLALENHPDQKTRLSDDQDVSPDSYELHFNDDSNQNLAIL